MNACVRPWSGEPVVVMRSIDKGKPIVHNFYHCPAGALAAAIERQQWFEYQRGMVAWVEQQWQGALCPGCCEALRRCGFVT